MNRRLSRVNNRNQIETPNSESCHPELCDGPPGCYSKNYWTSTMSISHSELKICHRSEIWKLRQHHVWTTHSSSDDTYDAPSCHFADPYPGVTYNFQCGKPAVAPCLPTPSPNFQCVNTRDGQYALLQSHPWQVRWMGNSKRRHTSVMNMTFLFRWS